ncbi:MAG TPA: hypothetical protein VFW52_01530, partial [Candidatus Saccharimonadales bacterium]|nr:hypothetical protein [Candidatus Saccharimonadales bacterium]
EGGNSFELPVQPPPEAGEQAPEQAVEQQRPASQEAGVGKRAPQPGSTAVAGDAAVQAPAQPSAPSITADDGEPLVAPVSPLTAGFKAHESDLIEKEWIGKTKEIVAKTTDDPHKQKEELSRVKADYIHKRFNKIIKTDEAAA